MKTQWSHILATAILGAVAGCAMSPPSNPSPRAVVEAKFAAVNRHAVADVVKLYSPDARITSSGFCNPRHGSADVQRTYQALFADFPGIVADVLEYVVQGDRVAVRFIARMKIQGRSIDVPIYNFFTVRNGLIEADEGMFDTGGRPCTS
jgi:hypothetical protein